MKSRILQALTLCLAAVAGLQITLAQTSTINATVYEDKVRFESLAPNSEVRVEIFDASGRKLFDSGIEVSRIFDWNMLDQQNERVVDGVYDCVVTTRNRNGKKSEIHTTQLAIDREGRNLENAPTLVQPATPGSGGGSGNVTGGGTAGQITKWTGATTIGDSILTEKDSKVGLGTTNPVSLVHILGSHPITSTLTGTNATEALRIVGGKGGDTSGSGQTAGNGANLVLQAGDGGDALTGTSGRGGFVTIQPGAAGVGSISGGFGQVIIAPGGGNVGIGVTNPGSRLTVAGMIETTLGGLKFPDGTIQTTAASGGLTSVFHDATLSGSGTNGSPLGVADGGIGTAQLANAAVTLSKVALGQVVTSLNGLKDQVILQAGSNITITPSSNMLTIAAPSALTSIAHDATLSGNGSTGSPLGVNVPLVLSGSVPTGGTLNAVVKTTNTADGGIGITVFGGTGNVNFGGSGVFAIGGDSNSSLGGTGVDARGGDSTTNGGVGLHATGGNGTSHGGFGIIAQGGNGDTFGGVGLDASGGGHGSGDGNGNPGLQVIGGEGSGAGHHSGDAMIAFSKAGVNGADDGIAGRFIGDLIVTGNLNVTGTKNFKIDHPLDPENKYLVHAAIESAEVLNIYSGNVKLDVNGEAIVELPEWFEAVNRDFRYSLTPVGAPGSGLFIAQEIAHNRFKIAGGTAGMKVSWQVTGVRSDATLLKHPFKAEQDKTAHERGYYLDHKAYDQAEERSIVWRLNPQLMQQLKQRQIEQNKLDR